MIASCVSNGNHDILTAIDEYKMGGGVIFLNTVCQSRVTKVLTFLNLFVTLLTILTILIRFIVNHSALLGTKSRSVATPIASETPKVQGIMEIESINWPNKHFSLYERDCLSCSWRLNCFIVNFIFPRRDLSLHARQKGGAFLSLMDVCCGSWDISVHHLHREKCSSQEERNFSEQIESITPEELFLDRDFFVPVGLFTF